MFFEMTTFLKLLFSLFNQKMHCLRKFSQNIEELFLKLKQLTLLSFSIVFSMFTAIYII